MDILGIAHSNFGNYCGLCESEYIQHRSLSSQAAELKLVTSSRRTSEPLLTVIRDGLLLKKIMEMTVGPNEAVRPKFAQRLRIANLRRLLMGRPYGPLTIFILLNRVWTKSNGENFDCLDKVFDFLFPLEDALMTWKWNSLRISERVRRRWHEHFASPNILADSNPVPA